MENLEIEIENLKKVFDYVSEAIIVTDEKYNMVIVNGVALKKLGIEEDEVSGKRFTDYVPIDEQDKVLKTIANDDNSYFDIYLKKENKELFPVFLSGQALPLNGKTYGIITIVDITQIKEKEKEQLKKLKSHIITQATTHAKEANQIKGQQTSGIIALQEEVDAAKHEIFKLERKVTLFERENLVLNGQCEKIQEDSFSFEQVLDREIALSKRYDRKFSLAIVAIDEYKEFTEQVNNEAKKDLILRAFKKHFKSTIRTTDVIYYENSGLFYLILPNSSEVNITDLIERLLHAKRIDTKIVVRFNAGISHIYDKDTRDHLMYRARKSLETNIKENRFARSQ
ncbi:MAG: PAS domain-containing protein [Campylobacterota bacterium]|nr:PAS domain-containing protein [Campylobacterota bacterium]